MVSAVFQQVLLHDKAAVYMLQPAILVTVWI